MGLGVTVMGENYYKTIAGNKCYYEGWELLPGISATMGAYAMGENY